MQLSDEARAFLSEGKKYAVLATIGKDGVPQQTQMWYELQGDQIMMNTAQGRKKADYLERDNRISVCVADGYPFVTLTGTVELNDDQAVAQADIRRLATRYEGAEAAERMMGNFSKQHRITLRMTVDRIIENFR